MDTDDSRTSRGAERGQLNAVSVPGSSGDAGKWGDDGSVRWACSKVMADGDPRAQPHGPVSEEHEKVEKKG